MCCCDTEVSVPLYENGRQIQPEAYLLFRYKIWTLVRFARTPVLVQKLKRSALRQLIQMMSEHLSNDMRNLNPPQDRFK